MKTKYRIVTDKSAGFQLQEMVWWWPFWDECHWADGRYGNTNYSIEDAEALAKQLEDRKAKPIFTVVKKFELP